jgi:hypothetical protein
LFGRGSSVRADVGLIDVQAVRPDAAIASYVFHFQVVKLFTNGKRFSIDMLFARASQIFRRNGAGAMWLRSSPRAKFSFRYGCSVISRAILRIANNTSPEQQLRILFTRTIVTAALRIGPLLCVLKAKPLWRVLRYRHP